MYNRSMNKLTIKEKKFVANKVSGKTNAQSYIEAGYKASTRDIADGNASKVLAKEKIQVAIEQALEHHGATPEFAVGRLKYIAAQNDEIGAARLASKDILELHGWHRGDRPTVELQIANAFFQETRKVIDQ